MLYRIEVISDRGTSLVLPLQEISDGYFVTDVEGLNPVKANLVSSSFATMDGAQYQSSRREARNIILKLSMELGTTPVSVLRSRLYTFFMPKTSVKLRFYVEGMPIVEIEGRVEAFDSVLFSQSPEVAITMLCFDPDFYTIDKLQIPAATTPETDEVLIDYAGSVETGVLFRLSLNRDLVEGFSITHRSSDDSISTLDFLTPLSVGDVLEISTVAGAKGVTLIRADTTTSVLYGITPYSSWLNLFPGPNYIRIHAEGVPIPYQIEFTTKYGGL